MSLEETLEQTEDEIKSLIPLRLFSPRASYSARKQAIEAFRNMMEPYERKFAEQIALNIRHVLVRTQDPKLIPELIALFGAEAYHREPETAANISKSIGRVAIVTEGGAATQSSIDLMNSYRSNPELAAQIAEGVDQVAILIQSEAVTQNSIDLIDSHRSNPETAAKIAEGVRMIAYWTGSEAVTQNSIDLIDSHRSNPRLAAQIADGVAQVAHNSKAATQNFIDLIDSYRSNPGLAAQIAARVWVVAYWTKSEAATQSSIDLIDSYRSNPETATKIADGIARVAHYTESKAATQTYIDTCSSLNLDRFEDHVFEEFGSYFIANREQPEESKALGALVEKEKDFLNKQTSEALFPLAMILLDAEEEYHSRIKGLNDFTRLSLARAYAIAKANINPETKQNYLEHFYAGLKGTLDKNPANVIKWANRIVEGFKDHGDDYLRMVA